MTQSQYAKKRNPVKTERTHMKLKNKKNVSVTQEIRGPSKTSNENSLP